MACHAIMQPFSSTCATHVLLCYVFCACGGARYNAALRGFVPAAVLVIVTVVAWCWACCGAGAGRRILGGDALHAVLVISAAPLPAPAGVGDAWCTGIDASKYHAVLRHLVLGRYRRILLTVIRPLTLLTTTFTAAYAVSRVDMAPRSMAFA